MSSGEQRRLLVSAFSKAVAEHGYARLEMADVLRYAGVSRATFERHFQSMEQGLVAAQDAFLERLKIDVLGACEIPGGWPLRVRAAVESVLASVVEVSDLARVFAVEAAVSPAAAERQFAALDRFAALLRAGRRRYPRAASLPEATERALVGGVASIVSSHLLVENPQVIPALEGQLVELILVPYLGEDEAHRLATRT